LTRRKFRAVDYSLILRFRPNPGERSLFNGGILTVILITLRMKEQPPLGPRHLFEYEFSHAAPETPGNAPPADKALLSAFHTISLDPSCATAGADGKSALEFCPPFRVFSR
jgi:hypothetical protein